MLVAFPSQYNHIQLKSLSFAASMPEAYIASNLVKITLVLSVSMIKLSLKFAVLLLYFLLNDTKTTK